MYVHVDYQDDELRSLLLEALETFGRLNENSINRIVAIFHYLGKVDGGRIRLSQSDVYSLKWEANVADLRDEGLVGIDQKGYREYFLVNKKTSSKKHKEILEELKRMSYSERRKITLYLHHSLSKKEERILSLDELKKLLSDVRRGHSPST